jgi:hypothetical protein
VGEDRHEQELREFEEWLDAHRPHPADLAATQLVFPEELFGLPARPFSAKDQAFAANWWAQLLGFKRKKRAWTEIVERRSVRLTEVQGALADAALDYEDLVAGGVSVTTARRMLSSGEISRRSRSAPHVVNAKTVEQINAIIEQHNALIDDPAHPIRKAKTIPLTREVRRRVPFRKATAKIAEHARARRKPERGDERALPEIEYWGEQEALEDDPGDGPRDYQLYRTARLLDVRWGESCALGPRSAGSPTAPLLPLALTRPHGACLRDTNAEPIPSPARARAIERCNGYPRDGARVPPDNTAHAGIGAALIAS